MVSTMAIIISSSVYFPSQHLHPWFLQSISRSLTAGEDDLWGGGKQGGRTHLVFQENIHIYVEVAYSN